MKFELTVAELIELVTTEIVTPVTSHLLHQVNKMSATLQDMINQMTDTVNATKAASDAQVIEIAQLKTDVATLVTNNTNALTLLAQVKADLAASGAPDNAPLIAQLQTAIDTLTPVTAAITSATADVAAADASVESAAQADATAALTS